MTITTLSSHEFKQDTSSGKLAHVLLTIEEYQRLTGSCASIINMLVMPEDANIEFEALRAQGLTKQVDLS